MGGYRYSGDLRPIIAPFVPYVTPRPQILGPITWEATYDELSGRFYYFHPIIGLRWDLPPGESYRVTF